MMARQMKMSGVSWIGDIPVHWQTQRVKSLLEEISLKGFPNEQLLAATQQQGVIPKSMVGWRTVEAKEDGRDGFKLVEPNMFVISLRSFEGGIEHSQYRGIISSAYTVLQLTNGHHAFFKYMLKSVGFIGGLQVHKKGIREGQSISYSAWAKDELALPPKNEQIFIALYLDDRTTAIDSKMQLLEEKSKGLAELRKSVVHQAVTKGLDPNVAMKPSGVDWIGNVPTHWQMKRVKDITKCLDGKREPLNAVERAEMQGNIPYWGANNIVDYIDRFKLDGEYILLGEDGAPFDKPLRDVAFRVTGQFWPNNHIHVLHSRNNMSWLTYFLNAVDYSPYVGGATRLKLTQGDMNRIMLTMPPSSEQIAIAQYLDERTAIIDESIKTIAEQIVALKALRQSLIHEAVTGKIDVADYGYNYA